jgi:hypothetical protein
MDLEQFLRDSVIQRAKKLAVRAKAKQKKVDDEYPNRLQEKALYRRLIEESDAAQDGTRFIWWFTHPARHSNKSLDYWRKLIDKEIENARSRSAVRSTKFDTDPLDKESEHEQTFIEQLSDQD